jgi:hypothetical protein
MPYALRNTHVAFRSKRLDLELGIVMHWRPARPRGRARVQEGRSISSTHRPVAGIEVTPDGAAPVVAASGRAQAAPDPPADRHAAVRRKSVRGSVQPDNLRWTAGGYLLLEFAHRLARRAHRWWKVDV